MDPVATAGDLRGRLRPGSLSAPAPADAVLEGLTRLARGHRPGSHEGPGALVAAETWHGAVRNLADDLLRPALAGDGTLPLGPLSPVAEQVLQLVYPEPAEDRAAVVEGTMPSSPTWQGHLVVVVGCGRRGTTWLERMLMASPRAGGVDGAESFLFEQCGPLWGALERMSPLVDVTRLAATLRRFCDTVLGAALDRHSPGATHFVEKTPLHSLLLPQVRAVYPDASYVHVVRDGRDVARSISQVGFFGLPDPADAARLWRRVVEEVRHQAPTLERFREVRYETLLLDPVASVAGLLTWLGLEVDDDVTEQLRLRAGTRVSTHAGVGQAVGAGTWRALPARALSEVHAECGALLVSEGYLRAAVLRRARLRPSYWRRRLARVRALRA